MKVITQKLGLFVLVSVFSISATAQTGDQYRISSVFAVLTKTLDSKSAFPGQELALRTLSDVVVDGVVVIPKDSKMMGRVTQVTTKGKDGSPSAMAVVIDKAVKSDGSEISVQAIIAAVAAPTDNSLSSDPTYGMMRSNEPKMASRPSTAASSGELSAGSKATST